MSGLLARPDARACFVARRAAVVPRREPVLQQRLAGTRVIARAQLAQHRGAAPGSGAVLVAPVHVDVVLGLVQRDACERGAHVSYLIEVLSECGAGCTGPMGKPLQTTMAPGAAMAHWLASRDSPVSFTLDRDCELKMPDDQKSTVRYSRHMLEIDEVAEHIAAGKIPTQLSMTCQSWEIWWILGNFRRFALEITPEIKKRTSLRA